MYRDVRKVTRGTPEYPAPLDGGDEESAPPTLWLRGQVPEGRRVAVVGARAATAGGLVAARAVAVGLAGAEITVVSGGALGIDGAAHRGALDAGGRTVVVLGTGIDVIYPRQHAGLFDEAVARGGAVMSQFEPGTPATRWGFPRRNTVIAALADTVVVVEAGSGSGALYTAAAARQLGRRLVVLRGSSGCDGLAAAGAEHAGDADELLALVLDGASVSATGRVPLPPRAPRRPPLPDDPRARRLYEALDATPRDLGELAVRAGVPAGEAMALAIDLELGGLAARSAGGRYLRLS